MTRPVVILDPHWRGMSELFSDSDEAALRAACDVIWGQDAPIPADVLEAALPRAHVLIAATPQVDAALLDRAPQLRMVIEVSGAFPDTIDYDACAARGVQVLSCAPGFRQAVAEMALGMAISGARGLITQHEGFRRGEETWLEDNAETDFTLYGAQIGFVGFGQIAQEITRLMAPFGAQIRAYDPWLPPAVASDYGITLTGLEDLMGWARCLFVAAVPTAENNQLINAERLALMPRHGLVVLVSRAHLVDFDALRAAVERGHIRAAVDVFPSEPAPADDPLRRAAGVTLSPHRAAAVAGGRQLIGKLIVSDIRAMIDGSAARQLGVADAARIRLLAGVGDATQVQDMAAQRKS